jgi:hypothetical protein
MVNEWCIQILVVYKMSMVYSEKMEIGQLLEYADCDNCNIFIPAMNRKHISFHNYCRVYPFELEDLRSLLAS